MMHLSLRLRIFLFFCLLVLGSLTVIAFGLWIGYGRVAETGPAGGFQTAGLISLFGVLALGAGIWLLFDENLAKPIEKIAADMRSRTHAGQSRALDPSTARYLGDLAPAARAVTSALVDTHETTAEQIAAQTDHLTAQQQRLTEILSQIPLALILVSPTNRIVLYDGQSAALLAPLGTPRLHASLHDYFDPTSLTAARKRMDKTGLPQSCVLTARGATQTFDAQLKPIQGGGYLLILGDTWDETPSLERPLTYDFTLLDQTDHTRIEDTPLLDLTYVVLDTETTGLLPHKDEIVQIGALRMVNGRIIPGEELDQLVDPGCPIPPRATKVHGITDALVTGQPDIVEAGQQFHRFAKGAVIVAHNAPFDMAFLHRHKARIGVTWDNPVLDTVLLSAVLFGASQSHTLDAICDRLGVVIPVHLRHTALGDATATAQALERMIPMLQARGMTTFGQVLDQTRRHGRLLQDLNN